MCSFNRGNIERTNFENLCLMVVYVLFYVCEVIGFVDWLDREVYKYESFEMFICLLPVFECPEMTLYGWH